LLHDCDISKGDLLTIAIIPEHRILKETSARLVWSRLHEVETLKASLQELGEALAKVEDIRRRMEIAVDFELNSANAVVATRLGDGVKTRYSQSFSEFFSALIAHLMPSEP
jgi:hypothetical protein